jgi:hypothetical protein
MTTALATAVLCIGMLTLGNAASVALSGPGLAPTQTPPVNAEAKVMADFGERVKEYLALRKAVEPGLPKLPEQASPIEIDRHPRAFGAAMAKARAGAKVGDLFGSDMQAVVRKLMARLFASASSRKQLRDSVMDENPTGLKFSVNGRYPDTVPLSTMPPDVLKNLPRLPEELEYRFVGDSLILLDPAAHMIVDYVPRALPR